MHPPQPQAGHNERIPIDGTFSNGCKFPEIRKRLGRDVTIAVRDMGDSDYAESLSGGKPWVVYFNERAMRSRDALEREYAKDVERGWFVKGTTASAIAYHEMGHLYEKYYKVDVRKALYNVFDTKDEDAISLYLKTEVSGYAGRKDFSEAVAEVSSSWLSMTGNEVAEKIARAIGLPSPPRRS